MTWGHRYGHRLRRGRTGELYLDKPHEVQRYRDAHAAILGCSLDEAATQDLPLTVAKELDGASQAHLLSGVSRHILFGTGGITQPDAEGPAVMQNDVRVSDADREAVASRLREHYAAGRLSLDEFQDRLDAVYKARVAGELNMVTDGLPHEGVVLPPGAPWGSYPGGGYPGGDYSLSVEQMRAAMARVGRRVLLAFALMTGGALLVLALLITAFMVHGGLFGVVVGVLLAILAAGVAAVAGLTWLARRLWLRHAWIEAVPLAVGQPWLSQLARMARLLLTGRALWRLRTRLASRG